VLLLRQSHPGRDDRRLAGEKDGVAYSTIGHDIHRGLGLPFAVLLYVVRGCRFLRKARHAAKRNLLFVYNEPTYEGLPFIIWARLLGYRVVVDIVEDAYLVPDAAPLLSRLKARSASWATRHLHWLADGVIVISSYLQRKLESIVGGRLQVALIPISVDFDRVHMLNVGFHRPTRLLYAGSFGEKDGIEYLIAAFEQAADRGRDIELIMTGRGSPERMSTINERIRRSPAAGRIRYLGFLSDDDYFRTIADCDILCVVRSPSGFADRGFPFKLGEYLATGRPVIASRVSDIDLYLSDRVNALLVQPGSVAEIVEAIEYLMADEPRALALGRAGRLVAERHFSARNNGRRLLELLDRMDSC
jgi:glycosyltransferase involved in cell wall biosynthesis